MYTEYKECSLCKKSLPADSEYFPKDSRRLNGLSSHCRTCNKFAVMKTIAKRKGLTLVEYIMSIKRNKLIQKENKEKRIKEKEDKEALRTQTKEEKAKFKQDVKEAKVKLELKLKQHKTPDTYIISNGGLFDELRK